MPDNNKYRYTYPGLQRELNPYLQTYGDTTFGPSLYDQYKNANGALARLNELNSVEGNVSPQQYSSLSANLQGQKDQAAFGAGAAVLGGIGEIAGQSIGIAGINDTPQYQAMIDEKNLIGMNNYGSTDELLADYSRGLQPIDFDYDTIRGGSKAERIGTVASTTLTGASTGLTVGGPWGALIGGAIGAGAGVAGWLVGDARAEQQQKAYETDLRYAQNNARKNLNARTEDYRNYEFRAGVGGRKAEGGAISTMSIKDFAERALKRTRGGNNSPEGRVIRVRCNGGVMIRIPRK